MPTARAIPRTKCAVLAGQEKSETARFLILPQFAWNFIDAHSYRNVIAHNYSTRVMSLYARPRHSTSLFAILTYAPKIICKSRFTLEADSEYARALTWRMRRLILNRDFSRNSFHSIPIGYFYRIRISLLYECFMFWTCYAQRCVRLFLHCNEM